MQNKLMLRSALSAGSVSFVLLLLTSPTPAFAGFQWVPPQQAESLEMAAPPVVAPVPVGPKTDFPPLVPQIIQAPETADMPMEGKMPLLSAPMAAPAYRPAETASVPLTTGSGDVGQVLQPPMGMMPVQAQPKAEAEVSVRGFGNNVPLTVALRQIIPPERGYSVDPEISLGRQVSWKGGAPWRQVLTDMLQSSGLMLREKGKMIHILPAATASVDTGGSELLVASTTDEKPDLAALSATDSQPVYLLPSSDNIAAMPAATMPIPAPVKEPAKADMPEKQPLIIGQVVPMGEQPPMPIKPSEPATTGYLAPPPSAAPAQPTAPVSLFNRDAVVDAWTANKGETLRDVLEAWCKRSHVEFVWQAEFDFPLQASISLGGSFEEAVRNLLIGFENASPQPVATLHDNQVAGQRVLVIKTRGNKYDD